MGCGLICRGERAIARMGVRQRVCGLEPRGRTLTEDVRACVAESGRGSRESGVGSRESGRGCKTRGAGRVIRGAHVSVAEGERADETRWTGAVGLRGRRDVEDPEWEDQRGRSKKRRTEPDCVRRPGGKTAALAWNGRRRRRRREACAAHVAPRLGSAAARKQHSRHSREERAQAGSSRRMAGGGGDCWD